MAGMEPIWGVCSAHRQTVEDRRRLGSGAP
jgi:hypothetical protein